MRKHVYLIAFLMSSCMGIHAQQSLLPVPTGHYSVGRVQFDWIVVVSYCAALIGKLREL